MLPIIFLVLDDADRSFFHLLYEQYRAAMWYCAYDIIGDKEQADDLVHTAFTYLMDKPGLLLSLSKQQTKAYAIITVKHAAIRYSQKAGRVVAWANLDAPNHETPEEIYNRMWEQEQVRNAASQLSDLDREILFLRYEIGLDYKCISHRLGIANGAARTRASRAVGRVKDLLHRAGVSDG